MVLTFLSRRKQGKFAAGEVMYRIMKRNFGYQLTFGGKLDNAEIVQWYCESESRLAENDHFPFSVIVDMRSVRSVSPATKAVIIEGQKLYRDKGMRRSVVIVDDPMMMQQLKHAAMTSGIYEKERYIDVKQKANWVNEALSWIRDGVFNDNDPE